MVSLKSHAPTQGTYDMSPEKHVKIPTFTATFQIMRHSPWKGLTGFTTKFNYSFMYHQIFDFFIYTTKGVLIDWIYTDSESHR